MNKLMRAKFHPYRFPAGSASIHWTFLPVIIWMIAANVSGDTGIYGFVWGLMMIFSLVIAILIHDLAQFFVRVFYRMPVVKMVITPIGSIPQLSVIPDKKIMEVLMITVGPLTNLAFAVCLFYFPHSMDGWAEPSAGSIPYVGGFVFQLLFLNLIMGLLNLIPSFPMDGGRLLNTMLEKKYSAINSKKIVKWISVVIAIALLILGLVKLSYLLLAISLFIFLSLREGKFYHPSNNATRYMSAKSYP
jgi:Zn-dependent protease